MELLTSVSCCLVALMSGSALAQKPGAQPLNPVPRIRLERVEVGNACSWCDLPSESKTIIDPKSIESVTNLILKHRTHSKKFRITRQDWNDLELFVLDPKILDAFTGVIGCPGCVDQTTGWVKVSFSDGTKKFVEYNQGQEPASITALANKAMMILSHSTSLVQPSSTAAHSRRGTGGDWLKRQ